MEQRTTEQGITKNQIVQELTRSEHGALEQFLPVGRRAVAEEAEFYAHLIAWNEARGQVRDAKVALPVIGLNSTTPEFVENALAHIALLDPRNLVRAVRFAWASKVQHRRNRLRSLIESYLRLREQHWGWWERTAVQHRVSMRELYSLCHIKPHPMAERILFKNDAPAGTIFADIRNLKNMSPVEAAGTILNRKIPFLVAKGALGKKLQDESVVLALINAMSPTELVTNMKMLEKLGVKDRPALRGALEKALEAAATSKKQVLKTTRAAAAQTDEKLRSKLEALQEKQLGKGSIEGNWLVLGDKSGSMASAIEGARVVAGTLARMVKGQVHLVFFDVVPRAIDVTGRSLAEIQEATRHVDANGGTSVGCGLQWAAEKGLDISGIAVVSDMQENTPPLFCDVYKRRFADASPPVYLYRVGGARVGVSWSSRYDADLAGACSAAGIDAQVFDLPASIDYHSLPNLVQTLRAGRYSLVEEIMETPLLTLAQVLRAKDEKGDAA